MGKDFKAAFHPDRYYHVFNHAAGKEQLFLTADNYRYFLHLFSKHIGPVGDIFCYCLLPIMFTFSLPPKQNKPSKIMVKPVKARRLDPHLRNLFMSCSNSVIFSMPIPKRLTSNKAALANVSRTVQPPPDQYTLLLYKACPLYTRQPGSSWLLQAC